MQTPKQADSKTSPRKDPSRYKTSEDYISATNAPGYSPFKGLTSKDWREVRKESETEARMSNPAPYPVPKR